MTASIAASVAPAKLPGGSLRDPRSARRPIAVVALLLVAAGAFAGPFVDAPVSVRQGDPFRVVVSVAQGSDVHASLRDGADVLSQAAAARVELPTGFSVWVAVLGVPCWQRPGRYVVDVAWSGGSVQRSIHVVPRDFVEESIYLNPASSAYRTDASSERYEQDRRLREVLDDTSEFPFLLDDAFRVPVEGARETSFFGDRRLYVYANGGSDRGYHLGWDLAIETGTPVHSPAPGVVVLHEDRIVTGLTLVVRHGPGLFSVYFHLSRTDVAEGSRVSAGDVLGAVGSTGVSTGPHLHWEVRAGGVAVEPKALLGESLLDSRRLYEIVYRSVVLDALNTHGDSR